MTSRHRAAHGRPGAPALVVLAAVAGTFVLSADSMGTQAAPGPSTTITSAPTPPSLSEPPMPGEVTGKRESRRVVPTRLDVPALGVSTDLIRLRLNADRTVEVPQDPDLAGWYALGTAPGERGSAVVLGHVDSPDGPAVFAELAELTPGSRIRVQLSDGGHQVFRVDRVRTYRNEDFPATTVYAGTTTRRQLNLVTCGGTFDAARGGWQSNVVVYSELLEPPS